MQRPTLLEGVLVALVLSLLAAPVVALLHSLIGSLLAWKAVVVAMAYTYICYLLVQRGRTSGRVTLGLLALIVLLAGVVLDLRLTSMLLLWLLYVSYLMLRKFSSTGQTHTLSAVLSVFAAIDVPIVFMSIRWWRTQHPAPVFGGGPDSGIDASMKPAFGWNVLAWALWGVLLLGLRYALERRRQEREQEAALQAIEASLEMAQ